MSVVDTFVNINNKELYFNSCESCESKCCDGANGISLSPMILDDFEEVYENFAILFGWQNKQVQPYMLINDGKGACTHYKDGKCTIYEKRAPACKLYPISPYFDEILVDTACPAVSETEGKRIIVDESKNATFYHKRLKNFKEKREESQEFYKSISNINDFKFQTHIRGMALLKYNKSSDNKYLQMHLESLNNLK